MKSCSVGFACHRKFGAGGARKPLTLLGDENFEGRRSFSANSTCRGKHESGEGGVLHL